MQAHFTASLSQQLNALLSEASLILQSVKVTPSTVSSKNKPAPSTSFLQRSVLQVRDLPECLRESQNLQSLSTEALAYSISTLKKLPSCQTPQAQTLLSQFSGELSNLSPFNTFRLSRATYSSRMLLFNPTNKQGFSIQNFLNSRRFFGSNSSAIRYINQRRLQLIETEANASPNDSAKQAEFYKANHPNAVIARFERGRYAHDEECLQAYVIALARVGQSDKILPKIVEKLEQLNIEGGLKFSTADLVQNILKGQGKKVNVENGPTTINTSNVGNKENPIYVVVDEARGYIFWRALRWLGITLTYAFCIFTFLSIAMENSGLLKTGGSQSEYEPSSQQIVKFSDVHGVDEAKEELEELVEFLKDPSKFTNLGGKLPKGVLLTGPPGTGKTLLARAVAGEAGVPFFFMSGSEFDEMYVGVGARRVRELFAPSIVFIDELDAIGSKRNPKDQTYMKQTLNQLLVDLDGFSQTEGVIFIAATNFPELLDKALIRPGRFDRHVAVPLPDVRGRMQILSHHLQSVQISHDVDISVVARGTPGFSGADLANLINQAAIQASRDGAQEVSMRHMEYAKDKIIMGAERKSAVITDESKRVTAYHEGGHTLVALYTPGALPLHKATIMPRGSALGMTVQLPEIDRDSYTKKEYLAMVDVCMAGRVAEELIFGKENVTSGSHNDIMKATEIAKNMVRTFGMSDKVGPVAHSDEDMENLSTKTKLVIESEIKSLVENAQARATNILRTHKDELHRLAKALMDYETLTQEEIDSVVKGKNIQR
ncbi:13962_t:CDS:10 [Entrophospora sp. SA101]|nr:12601_t:CDS:10 [Entrophospora sp. SA101]CAJ0766886.1 9245_t:CDS:10 [Entrophospora sp. SA101]CAJ0768137.1 13962_t:CDS:10 [Entrophospora sp. SA101]CAJ0837363.1 5019_t:CDS:10 [Entrophospora sp. SA101]CAJ0837628.1 9041_t:CDS:10 [Entrophospora sp. SA101]